MQLSLSISLSRNAFVDPNTSAPEPISQLTNTAGKKGFLDDLKETDREKLLRERKKALNTLFDKADLHPYIEDGNMPTGTQSKRAMLDKMEKRTGIGDEEDEDELNEIQLNLVCKSERLLSWVFADSLLLQTRRQSRTTRACRSEIPQTLSPSPCDPVSVLSGLHDCSATEMRPARRPEASAALDGGHGDGRRAGSQESLDAPAMGEVPLSRQQGREGLLLLQPVLRCVDATSKRFVASSLVPSAGELSLVFPKASTKCRGGILADEMGLGKTIMVASLCAQPRDDEALQAHLASHCAASIRTPPGLRRKPPTTKQVRLLPTSTPTRISTCRRRRSRSRRSLASPAAASTARRSRPQLRMARHRSVLDSSLARRARRSSLRP